jgi:hypothetical protein
MTMGRNLVWNDEAQQWHCSECAWVFEPSDLFADKALNKYFDVVRRDEEFVAHLCANHHEGGQV